MKTEKKEENTSKKTSSCTTTKRTREVKSRLLVNLLEKKIHYVSAPGPPLQLGKPPRGGRKMAAMVLIHLNRFLRQRLHQEQLAEIIRNHMESPRTEKEGNGLANLGRHAY